MLDSVPSGRARLVAAVLCAAAASGAAVSLMGVSAWLISKAAQHPPFLELSVAAVGVRFFGIARAVFRYVERLVGHDIALRMQTALRLRSYAALARTTLVGRAKGDLLVRVVSDVSAIEDVVVRVIQPFCAAVLVVAGCGALIARFSPAAAGTLVLSAIAGGIIVPWLAQRLSSAADAAAAPLRGRLGQTVHDITLTAPDVAAYGAETRSLARVDALDDRLRHTDARAAWARGLGDGLQVIAAGAAILAGLVIGATAVADGAMGDRLLAVLVLIPLALHEVFANFSQAAQTLTRARVSLARVDAILEAEPIGRGDAILAPSGEPGTITCRNLTIGWPGGEAIADGLDLSLAPGRSVAITGPSGIGKTTWAATIMGLIPPLGGDLATSGRIGYLAQDAHIFATTVAENVRIGAKDATDEDVAAALAEAGLPLDPQRRIGEGGSTLSGGEARRLSLARLFAGDSALLILDEPTEHLDRETADRLADDIWSRLGERPVLVITHDERLAARCNEVVEMH
ncbi:MAG: thiol reductant ABC exporter subunit CydC [Propionibacteriaceae bacterium]|nr:thiol reductant ABC exporter subunit CydC [Propionibacteriaceae bacterium]